MLVDLALSTGLRVSEMVALKIKDVDLKRGCMSVTRRKRKKKVKESLAISKDLVQHLKDYITWTDRKSGALFVGARGPLTAQGLQRIWKASIKRAGLPKELSIHSARHTIAVHLLKKTSNLRQVQKQLGHASPATTANMYADISFEDMQNGVTGLYEG
jgi:integrase